MNMKDRVNDLVVNHNYGVEVITDYNSSYATDRGPDPDARMDTGRRPRGRRRSAGEVEDISEPAC